MELKTADRDAEQLRALAAGNLPEPSLSVWVADEPDSARIRAWAIVRSNPQMVTP